jgi:acyl-CoA dehydrogenase
MTTTTAEEQQELVALAHEFAEKEIRPLAAQYDELEESPWDIFYKAAEVGLTSFDLPEGFGGGGIHSLLTGCQIYEELAWSDSNIGQVVEGGSFFSGPIIAVGTQ